MRTFVRRPPDHPVKALTVTVASGPLNGALGDGPVVILDVCGEVRLELSEEEWESLVATADDKLLRIATARDLPLQPPNQTQEAR